MVRFLSKIIRIPVAFILAAIIGLSGCASTANLSGATSIPPEELDAISQELTKPYSEFDFLKNSSPEIHNKPFFEDAFAIIALCRTGDAKRIGIAKRWADKMIEYQTEMVPAGAYYMNYFRKPGSQSGDWYTADASSIALGILAVAGATADEKYYASVDRYVQLVEEKYINPDGGVSDGIWGSYTDSWWSSTANFGTLMLELYKLRHVPKYLTRAKLLLGWLNERGLKKFAYPDLNTDGPAIVFYVGAFVGAAKVAAVPESSFAKLEADLLDWLQTNPDETVDCRKFTYMAGMPAVWDRLGNDQDARDSLIEMHSKVRLDFVSDLDVDWSFACWDVYSQSELQSEVLEP